jgi:predicted AAA+ superfamily ATPase
MVASTMHGISIDLLSPVGLFYDAEKRGVDFIIKLEDKTIPLEVGIGNKTKSQLIRSMNKYNAQLGILVSNRTSRIKYENNILYIPVSTFALI